MDGLENKINKILSDPEALSNVMNIAKSLSAGSGSASSSDRGEPAEEATTTSGGNDRGDLGLMGMLGGMDPALISKLLSIMGEYNRSDDSRTMLFKALKPYLKKERQDKLDQASNIMRIARTASTALDGTNIFGRKNKE